MAKSASKSTTGKTAAKPAARKSAEGAAPKPVRSAVATPEPAVIVVPVAAVPVSATPVLRIKDMLDRVVERSGARKAAVRPVLDAVLAELGEALSRGDSLSLPPLGKARVSRSKSEGGAEVIVVKLRRGAGKKDEVSPLAPDDE